MTDNYCENEMYVEFAHLPQNRLKRAIFSDELPCGIRQELENLKIVTYCYGGCDVLDSRISCHPDMSICDFGRGRYAARSECKELLRRIQRDVENKCGRMMTEYPKDTLSNDLHKAEYPFDAIYNCLYFRERLFCRAECADEINSIAVNEGITYIRQKQGYVKCSTCVVGNNAVITEDPSICKAIKGNCDDVDVLFLSSREIILRGYNCGFIGGASFKLSKDAIAFFGKIEKHKEYENIRAFCKNHGVECISLSSDAVYDYGGAICVTEER